MRHKGTLLQLTFSLSNQLRSWCSPNRSRNHYRTRSHSHSQARSRKRKRLNIKGGWMSGQLVHNLNSLILDIGWSISPNGADSSPRIVVDRGSSIRVGHGGIKPIIIGSVLDSSESTIWLHDAKRKTKSLFHGFKRKRRFDPDEFISSNLR